MKHLKLAARLAFCLMIVFSFSLLAAQEGTEQEETYRQAIIDGAAALSTGDFDAFNQLVAEDYVVHSPLGDMDAATVAGLFTAFRSALTDFEMTSLRTVVDGDMVTSHFRFSGMFENEFVSPMGVFPPTGQPVAWEGMNIFQFNDEGRVVEEWVQFDTVHFLTQFGAMGAPAAESTEAASGAVITEEMAGHFAERFEAMFDGPRLDIADEIFAPNFVSHHLPLAPELDLESFKAYVASFYEGISDMTQETHQVIFTDDRVILHVTYTGTHDGVVLGIPATGNTVTVNGIGIFAFDENGLATDNWAVIDVGGLLAQIGGLPSGE